MSPNSLPYPAISGPFSVAEPEPEEEPESDDIWCKGSFKENTQYAGFFFCGRAARTLSKDFNANTTIRATKREIR